MPGAIVTTRSIKLKLLLIIVMLSAATTTFAADKLNVLFIAVDDLRTELSCYGATHISSPNIDRLAQAGTLFHRAYCQQAVCNSSRASLMTGMRPDSLKVWELHTHFRDVCPAAVTIAQHFKDNGYHTERVGKIFHTGHGNRDDADSWSRPARPTGGSRYSPKAQAAYQQRLREAADSTGKSLDELRRSIRGVPYEAADVEDDQLSDGAITKTAIRILDEVGDKPFFLAVGYLNPHLPFVSPSKYWNLYDSNEIELAENPSPPKDAPAYALTNWGELRKYHGIPTHGPLSNQQAIEMRRGYYSAVSFVDAQIGRLLDAIESRGLRDDTIVVLWGDHGWKLGEHGMWCKHTNFELDARVPLIVSVPNQSSVRAGTYALVELIDVFPTLCELAGLDIPPLVDGRSFIDLLNNPSAQFKTTAFSQYPRRKLMGYSMRTEKHRFTIWQQRRAPYQIEAMELYDHEIDPDENTNIVSRDTALAAKLKKKMVESGVLLQ